MSLYITLGIILTVFWYIYGIFLLFYKEGRTLRDNIFENTWIEEGLNCLYDKPSYDDITLLNTILYSILTICLYLLLLLCSGIITIFTYPLLLIGLLFYHLIKKRIKNRENY